MNPLKSPIKRASLNMPGRTLFLRLIDLLVRRALLYMVSMYLVGIAMASWLQWWRPTLMRPARLTLAAAASILVTWVYVRRQEPLVRNIELGLEGERDVADTLHEVCADLGYRVFHSIADDGFDIDHMLIGPAGAFVIETKTHSKPARGDCRVTYDGKQVLVNGHRPDRDPIAQVRANANRVAQLLYEHLGERVPVRGIVLYPGWLVDEASGAEVWVLAPKRLFSWLRTEESAHPVTKSLTVRMSEVIARYIRESKNASLKQSS